MDKIWNLPREVVEPRYKFLVELFSDCFGESPFTMLEIGVHKARVLESILDSRLNLIQCDGVDPYSGKKMITI